MKHEAEKSKTNWNKFFPKFLLSLRSGLTFLHYFVIHYCSQVAEFTVVKWYSYYVFCLFHSVSLYIMCRLTLISTPGVQMNPRPIYFAVFL